MYRLVVLSLLAMACNASPYGSVAIRTSPIPVPIVAPAPLAAPVPLPVAAPVNTYSAPVVAAPVAYAAPVQQSYGPIEAAVQTRRTFEIRPVIVDQALSQPQVIDISPNYEAALIHFRTASSRLNVQQSHELVAPGTVEHSSVQDNPHRLVHDVTKPVIQEVREVIQPFRRITQEIRPVIEEIHTVVHKGERRVAVAPLPLQAVAPAYGAGAAIAANAGYKAAKAA